MSRPLSDILPAFFVKLKSLPTERGWAESRLAFKLSPITFQSGKGGRETRGKGAKSGEDREIGLSHSCSRRDTYE